MPRRYVAFDFETAKILPAGTDDLLAYRPLGITCAATLIDDSSPKVWYGRRRGRPAARMGQIRLRRLVSRLTDMVAMGYTILTWNGLSFDFNVLAEESGMFTECVSLALQQVDMMFHIVCLRGHRLALETAAEGMGLPGKLKGMTGLDAPVEWAAGRYPKVLRYLAQDVRTTLDVAHEVERCGYLRWTSRRGNPTGVQLTRWLTVTEALNLPVPDTSWMDAPEPRIKFIGWTLEELRGPHIVSR